MPFKMCQKSTICTPNFFHFWEGHYVPGFALYCITPWPILYLNKNYIIKSVMVWGRYPYRFIKNCFKNNILWCYNYKHFLLDFVKMATSDDNEAHQIIIQYAIYRNSKKVFRTLVFFFDLSEPKKTPAILSEFEMERNKDITWSKKIYPVYSKFINLTLSCFKYWPSRSMVFCFLSNS